MNEIDEITAPTLAEAQAIRCQSRREAKGWHFVRAESRRSADGGTTITLHWTMEDDA